MHEGLQISGEQERDPTRVTRQQGRTPNYSIR